MHCWVGDSRGPTSMAFECTISIKDWLSQHRGTHAHSGCGCACSVLFFLREPSPSLFWTVC